MQPTEWWSKTAPFSFENGLVWMGPQTRACGTDLKGRRACAEGGAGGLKPHFFAK